MKKIALIALASSALVLGGVSQMKFAKVTNEERDAKIIVKMKDNVETTSQKVLMAQQNNLLNQISTTITSNYKVTSRYTNIFNGFVLEVPAAYVSQIRALNRVDMVNYNGEIDGPSANDGAVYDVELPLGEDTKTASAMTMEKPEGTNDGAGTFIAILDVAFYIQNQENGEVVYHEVFSPLDDEDAIITQESLKAKIDAAGASFHGKYDATHSTYLNSKVPFYFDYAGDNKGTCEPDYDVYAEGQDHGTHVASIAGGNAGAGKYQGIAPRSQMALMKVFNTWTEGQSYKSGGQHEAILNALEDCLILGVDTINMSLGSNLDDFSDNEILQQTIKHLEENGQFVNVAAGNAGKEQWSGTGYKYWSTNMVETNIISSYANNMSAMTVASTRADFQFYGEALSVDGHNVQYEDEVTNYKTTDKTVTYDPQRYLTDLVTDYGTKEFEFVYFPGTGNEEEYTGVNVTGKIAVVNRGDTTFREKVESATTHGAIALIVVNNTEDATIDIRMSFGDDDFTPAIPVAFVTKANQTYFADATTNKCEFLINVDLENPYTRTISDYSSDGMKYDLSIKPEISAPGENIKGAVLGGTDKYESMSGTSMATPNMTGATALMIGEHLGDANYRKTINARLMSTAVPMTDLTLAKNFTSVRRQGAGLINLDSAINSQIYLNGLNANGQVSGKAKIELFNNDDIKQGKLKLSFAAVNEGDTAVTYTATTYVLAPAVDEYSEEVYPQFAGVKFQTTDEQLVETFTDTITVPANATTTINLPEHAVAAEKLAALSEVFEDGCILEGYVILTAEDNYQLSIPFLGYYGDLDAVSPVEPFAFERNSGDVYTSDLLNYLITENIKTIGDVDYTYADFTSQIVTGYWANTGSISVSKVIGNTSALGRMTDGNGNRVNQLGMNPLTGEFDAGGLYVGNNGFSNTMIIQQYVTRSVRDNVLTLKNKATGEVVLTDHMFDALYGSQYDATTQTTTYPLYKSHFNDSMIDNGYFASRAYTIIPLYSKEGNTITNYPDGEYEMTFSYDMMAGGTYTVTYDLTINSELPILKSVERVGENYRLHYTDTTLAVLKVNSTSYTPIKDDNGVYIDIPMSSYADSDKVILESQNLAFAKSNFMTHLNDELQVMLYNKMITSAYDFTYSIEKTSDNDQKMTVDITKNGKSGTTSGNIVFRMLVPEGLDVETLKVFTVAANGKEKEITYTVDGDFIQFESAIRILHFTSDTLPTMTGITVSGPTKTSYKVGETLDLTGLAVTLNYSSGKTVALTSDQYRVSTVDMSSEGTKTVTVTYESFTATFSITVVKEGGDTPVDPDKPSSGGGCGGSIIASSVIISTISLLGFGLMFFRKKEDK